MMLELNPGIRLVALLLLKLSSICLVQSMCNRGCDLVASSVQRMDLGSISQYINTNTTNVLDYNPKSIPYHYQVTNKKIALKRHANLTSKVLIQSFNSSHINRFISYNVTVVCSCVGGSISKDFLFFSLYGGLRPEDALGSVSFSAAHTLDIIDLNKIPFLSVWQRNSSYSAVSGPVSIPIKRNTLRISRSSFGKYGDFLSAKVNANDPPLKTCSGQGLSHGATVGITLGVVIVVVMSHARCLYNGVYRKKKAAITSACLWNAQVELMPLEGLAGIRVDKAVEFSYEELLKATNDFNLGKKIGQGGFGAVYYGELRGEKAAIKKMDVQASKEFLAELKVLTHVHHQNLVRLIGYCVEASHFLVFEYVENGNLSQHLHESGKDPLPWSTRVQIALDSARGLEYIHEYTVSVFIHCDIKSANILVDKNFRGKVADFGLTRLTEVGSRSRLVGTFGYMSPEYAQYGDVSPKVDVYAFGVVLYELISAKKAIIRTNGFVGEPKGLVALFDEVLSQADPEDALVKMIDPRLRDNYPLDSVHKMAQLANACTHEDPRRRPHMRYVVVALMNLSSSMED